MKNLQFSRPLVCLDLETTGINPLNDRIVEFAGVKVHPDGTRETLDLRVHPGRPIPAAATAIHGIHDDDVKDAPRFSEVARRIRDFLTDCDLAGYNAARFDVPLLQEELRRADLPFPLDGIRLLDAQVIFHKKEPRTLEAALRFYCGREHGKAHQALGDVEATLEILDAQLGRYPEIPRDVESLHRFCDQKNPNFVDRFGKLIWHEGEACLNFGPHRLKPLREIVEKDSNFLEWMIRKDFSAEVKNLISDAMKGVFPEPPREPDETVEKDRPATSAGGKQPRLW